MPTAHAPIAFSHVRGFHLMGYDVYLGARFPGARHAMTVDERLFDRFVEAHLNSIPPFRLVTRMKDPYGDADYRPDELARLVAELNELERHTASADVRDLCKTLVKIARLAIDEGVWMFCRGD